MGKAKRPKLVDARYADALATNNVLLGYYRQISKADLGDPNQVVELHHVTHGMAFYHMGRALTQELIRFIRKEKCRTIKPPTSRLVQAPGAKLQLKPMPVSGVHGFRYIIGTAGAGKSCSVAAAFLYLYGKFASDRAAVSTTRMSRRIMLVDGGEMAEAPEDALWNGLSQAFVDDEAALRELESRKPGQMSTPDVKSFLSKRPNVSVTIVVDDGNKLPKGSPGQQLLCSLIPYCVVVFCVSVSSEWVQILRHPKATQYMLVSGGLDETELRSYLDHFDFSDVNISEAGRIPRLMEELKLNKEDFNKSIKAFKKGWDTFLLDYMGRGGDLEELQKELSGAYEVSQFSLLLETRCFYRGTDHKVKALTPDLAAYARATLAKLLYEDDIDRRWKQVNFWVQAIAQDDNIVRIGWNAEMAAILSMKFMTEGFYYATGAKAVLATKHIHYFNGQMSRSLLTSQRPREATAHFPYRYNHIGLDGYLEDENYLIAAQISVARNAPLHHRKTVEKAEELFDGDSRIKVLAWVIHTSKWASYRVKSKSRPELEYFVVFMPFAYLSVKLSSIDEKLDQLRKDTTRKAEDFCSSCLKTDGVNSNWVQCDSCDLWYHQDCVGYSEPNEAQSVEASFADIRPDNEGETRPDVNSVTEFPYMCPTCVKS